MNILPARGKQLSKLGKEIGCKRRFYEFDWIYRKRLIKHLIKSGVIKEK